MSVVVVVQNVKKDEEEEKGRRERELHAARGWGQVGAIIDVCVNRMLSITSHFLLTKCLST